LIPINNHTIFEQNYLQVRSAEGRLYSDAELAALPCVCEGHPLYDEWKIRKKSCQRLIVYLQQKASGLKILEIGCGNGWLAAQLAKTRHTILLVLISTVKNWNRRKECLTNNNNFVLKILPLLMNIFLEHSMISYSLLLLFNIFHHWKNHSMGIRTPEPTGRDTYH
jgi:SAM-dependent methyltransferase